MAMMSHISRACSRRSSGKPFAGRSIENTGRFFCLARSSALSLFFRMPSTRFSTSRTLVRYSSSLALSVELIWLAESRGVVLHAIEDAHVAQAAAVLEQVVPGQRRIDFVRHRRIRALPGDVRAVRHREVGLVVAGHRLLASQHDAGLRRVLADAVGDHLVDGDAGLDDGALLNRARRRAGCRSARGECPVRWRASGTGRGSR